MYDCVYNPKYNVHNSLSRKILLYLCVILLGLATLKCVVWHLFVDS